MPETATTIGELIRVFAAQLESAGVFCGHGTDNPLDEAAALVLHAAGLAHRNGPARYAQTLSRSQRRKAEALLQRRIEERVPMPYLTHETWFAGLRFYVDRRVLIPRSPIAELIGNAFSPWLGSPPPRQILELGTGSGCIAIACARAFPRAQVVATDLDSPALEVARLNVARHGLSERVHLVQADLFAGLRGRYDLIVANPPYVGESELRDLPPEYAWEPQSALTSGPDALETPRRILQDAAGFLTGTGLLVLEVGAGWRDLEQAFPRLPFIWPALEQGGEGVALIWAADLGSPE